MATDWLSQRREVGTKMFRGMMDATHGHMNSLVSMWELADDLHLDHEEVEAAVDYLVHEGLLQYMAMGGQIAVTHQGVKEYERLVKTPSAETEHFSSLNLVAGNTFVGSQIQVGSNNVVNVGNRPDLRELAREVVEWSKANPNPQGLTAQDLADLKAEIETLRGQLRSSRSKDAILIESIKTARDILPKAGPAAVELLAKLFSFK